MTMDLIIDDGPHTLRSHEVFLQVLFCALKPGGYYIIEDVFRRGIFAFRDSPETALDPKTLEILQANDAILVDSTTGHRNWTAWERASGKRWVQARNQHNSNVVIIRRRMS